MNKTINKNLKLVWLYMLITIALLPFNILSLILKLRILFDSVLIIQTYLLFAAVLQIAFTTLIFVYLVCKEGITNEST